MSEHPPKESQSGHGKQTVPYLFLDMVERRPTPDDSDPLFDAVEQALAIIWNTNGQSDGPVQEEPGIFASQQPRAKRRRPELAYPDLKPPEMLLAAVYGLLETDNLTDPDADKFSSSISAAIGEYTGSQKLFDQVLTVIGKEGDVDDAGEDPRREVRADQWTAVARTLTRQGVTESDPLLRLKAQQALASQVGVNENGPMSGIAINLPDLEAVADIEIQSNNIQAIQALYFTAMLEELKLFQVVDKLLELFQNGMLPLGRGRAGDTLYSYWKKSINRMSESERRNLYARCFGMPGGDGNPSGQNREFNDLFLRFVSAVSAYVRQFTVAQLLSSTNAMSITQQQVLKSGRDLASNCSLHGYGMAYFAATELQGEISQIISLLSESEIKTAYGARDMWQVVEQVSSLELGGAKNSVRYRTMANAGGIILRWLSTHAQQLAQASVSILNEGNLRDNSASAKSKKPLQNPTDRDLVDACEQWLAVTGTQDDKIEELSQANESPANQTSGPIRIPQAARDLLDSVGIPASGIPGMGAAAGSGRFAQMRG